MNIGPLLKKIRLEKNQTLEQVAEKLNLSISHISQMENGKVFPSLNTLELILKLYAINISDFFRQAEEKKFIVVRKKEMETLSNPEYGFSLTLLASKLQNNALESFIVELNPGSRISTAIIPEQTNGERLIYVLSGSIHVVLEEKDNFTLSEGDSVNFKSYVSCVIRNAFTENARIMMSGNPPLLL